MCARCMQLTSEAQCTQSCLLWHAVANRMGMALHSHVRMQNPQMANSRRILPVIHTCFDVMQSMSKTLENTSKICFSLFPKPRIRTNFPHEPACAFTDNCLNLLHAKEANLCIPWVQCKSPHNAWSTPQGTHPNTGGQAALYMAT